VYAARGLRGLFFEPRIHLGPFQGTIHGTILDSRTLVSAKIDACARSPSRARALVSRRTLCIMNTHTCLAGRKRRHGARL